MPISDHPPMGTILICNFDIGFKEPEMVKRRPVIVISPKIAERHGLCTVVALSTTKPNPIMPYHAEITPVKELPHPWTNKSMWIKGDMIYTVAFHRLDLLRDGKDIHGKRKYLFNVLTQDQIKLTRMLVLKSIGLSPLTKHM